MLKGFIDFVDSVLPSVDPEAKDKAKAAIEQFERNAKSLLFRGNFTGDFNDTNILPGIYEVTASAQHIPVVNGTPFGGGYFTFIQFPTYLKTQQAIGRGIISRSYQGDPVDWTEWKTSPNV